MIKFIKLSALLLLVVSGTASSQSIQVHAKPNAHIDYNRLKRIDTLVNSYINNNWLRGAVTIVVKDNQLVQYKGYGYSNFETQKRMDSNAMFRIMSQTKAVTSIGILILYEEGKFLLDQDIADFIPSFKNLQVMDTYNEKDTTYTTVPAKRGITFRDLLTHTSGIDYPDIGSEKMKAVYAKAHIPSGLGMFNENLRDRMDALGKLPLVHQPGEKFTYGLNSDLLGSLIERMSGMNLEDFFRTRIFEPLGMKDSYFNVPSQKADRLAKVYTEDSVAKITPWGHNHFGIDADYPIMKKRYFSGGAGLSSTAFDYAVFLQMLLNKGKYNGHQILSPRTVEMILSGQLDFMFDGTNNFGLGFAIVTDKGAAHGPTNKGSFSWGGYYGTYYWADPKENLVCLIMTQQNPNSHGDLMKKIEALVYAAIK